MTNFLSMFKSRLLLPVVIVLIVTAALQIAINTWLTRDQVYTLAEQIGKDLTASTKVVSDELTVSEAAVQERLQSMRNEVATELDQKLSYALGETQQKTEASFKAALLASAQSMADAVAGVAVYAIWKRDIPGLTRMVRLANVNETVVFAGFFDKNGVRLTNYVNRKDERLVALLNKGTGKGNLAKVINAAKNDPSIVTISADIAPDGDSIGKFVMGFSTQQIDTAMQVLKEDFASLTKQSLDTVGGILEEQTQQVSNRLAISLAQTEATSGEAANKVQVAIERGSGKMVASLFATAALLSTGLVLLITIMLGTGVLSKVNVLKAAIWDIAEGEADLTQRAKIKGNDEITTMAGGLNQFISRIQQMMQEVTGTAQQATQQSTELTVSSDQATEAVNKQKQEIDQISSAITEMSTSIQQVAKSIQLVAGDVDHINEEAKATGTISSQVSNIMVGMRAEVEAAAAVVRKLDNQSHDIGSVLTVIKSIAEQTNLLALNAAIEAARAGESGRGFAVVADEVRNLASKTQQSTTEIESIISQLQQGSEEAVVAIDNTTQKVQASSDSFREADEKLENIKQLVGNLHSQAKEIASVANEQSSVSEEITENVTHIADSADMTASAMVKADQASAEINCHILALQKQTSQFRV